MLAPMSPVLFAIVAILHAANARVLHGGIDVDLDQNLNLDLNLNLSLDMNQNQNLDLDLNLKVELSQNQTIDEKPQDTPQTIDEVIAAAFHGDAGREERKDGMVRTEMDMWLTEEQYQALHGDPDNRQKRKATNTAKKWPNSKVWYRVAWPNFTKAQKIQIKKAFAEWQKKTCLTFHQDVKKRRRNYVYIYKGKGCSSSVGMIGGMQKISLGGDCFSKKKRGRTPVHELGHAIGFFHEQVRRDRGRYIQIIKKNIKKNMDKNFNKVRKGRINNYGVPYDLNSVMHYGTMFFSRNGHPTIKVIDKHYDGTLGEGYQLSFYDAMLANKMYHCDKGCRNRCPRGAYRGKGCTCYCRGTDPIDDPIRKCR